MPCFIHIPSMQNKTKKLFFLIPLFHLQKINVIWFCGHFYFYFIAVCLLVSNNISSGYTINQQKKQAS